MDRETVINYETPLEKINKLEHKYRSSQTRNVFDLFRQNHKIKYEGDISKLFSEVKRNALQLAEKNLKLPDSCIVAKKREPTIYLVVMVCFFSVFKKKEKIKKIIKF